MTTPKLVYYWPRFDLILEWCEYRKRFFFEAGEVEVEFRDVTDWSAFVKLGEL